MNGGRVRKIIHPDFSAYGVELHQAYGWKRHKCVFLERLRIGYPIYPCHDIHNTLKGLPSNLLSLAYTVGYEGFSVVQSSRLNRVPGALGPFWRAFGLVGKLCTERTRVCCLLNDAPNGGLSCRLKPVWLRRW